MTWKAYITFVAQVGNLRLIPRPRRGQNVECGDLSPLFYAATCRGSVEADPVQPGADKSPPTKALTSQRTPHTSPTNSFITSSARSG
jgi:hypothetical protein